MSFCYDRNYLGRSALSPLWTGWMRNNSMIEPLCALSLPLDHKDSAIMIHVFSDYLLESMNFEYHFEERYR